MVAPSSTKCRGRIHMGSGMGAAVYAVRLNLSPAHLLKPLQPRDGISGHRRVIAFGNIVNFHNDTFYASLLDFINLL